jgi:hypothetical protein
LLSLDDRADWLKVFEKVNSTFGINLSGIQELKESLSVGHIIFLNSNVTIQSQNIIDGQDIKEEEKSEAEVENEKSNQLDLKGTDEQDPNTNARTTYSYD